MRAITVCVDYADILAITLPYNRHHFEEVCVVTSRRCEQEIRDLILPDSPTPLIEIKLFVTDAFYEDGAKFNKWLALERALDWYGRHGWLCLMDADVLWPKVLPPFAPHKGNLYSPRRRMWESWPKLPRSIYSYVNNPSVPIEEHWKDFPLHRQQREFAGYSQIFHANDPALGQASWHQTDWRHAGGADSFFQDKWREDQKVRPPFEVLHLGPANQNWFGRATPLVDGSLPKSAKERSEEMGKIWSGRRANRAAGRDQFDGEKLG